MRTLKLVGALSVAGAILPALLCAGAGCPHHTSFRSCEAKLPKRSAIQVRWGGWHGGWGHGWHGGGSGWAVGALAAGALIGAGDWAFTSRLWS